MCYHAACRRKKKRNKKKKCAEQQRHSMATAIPKPSGAANPGLQCYFHRDTTTRFLLRRGWIPLFITEFKVHGIRMVEWAGDALVAGGMSFAHVFLTNVCLGHYYSLVGGESSLSPWC